MGIECLKKLANRPFCDLKIDSIVKKIELLLSIFKKDHGWSFFKIHSITVDQWEGFEHGQSFLMIEKIQRLKIKRSNSQHWWKCVAYNSITSVQYEVLVREHTTFKIQLERCELELDQRERSLNDLRSALKDSEARSRKIAQFVERQTEQIQHLENTVKQGEQAGHWFYIL